MKRILREPLLHFLVIGAVLFAVYSSLNPDRSSDPESIIVSEGQIGHMVATFTRTWQRMPTEPEMKGLVDQYVREEMLSREAVKLGLDKNDSIIRRRLEQKMEFLADGMRGIQEPTDEELNAYLKENSEKFMKAPQFTFRQVCLSPDARGDQIQAEVGNTLEQLKLAGPGADIQEMGDLGMLPKELENEPQWRVNSTFGEGFASRLEELPVGEWSGPVPSGYGLHLVFLASKSEATLPVLDDVRELVRREWIYQNQQKGNEQFLSDLLENYEVVIEWPEQGEPLADEGTASE